MKRGMMMKLFTGILFGLASFCLLTPANAATIGFTPGLPIQHTYGVGGTYATDYVEIDGYRFETLEGNKLAINTYTGEGRHYGGLWDSDAFGTASLLKITRIDGHAFSLASFSILEHAGFACYQNFCGNDSLTVQGYAPGSTTPFNVGFLLDGYNNTYDSFKPITTDARFGNVREVVIINNESLILDSTTLIATPLPASVWLFGSGLLIMFRRLSAVGLVIPIGHKRRV